MVFSWQNAKSNCHLRSEMSLSPSLSCSLFFLILLLIYLFCCLHISPVPPWDELCSPCMQTLTRFRDQLTGKNGKSGLAETESMARLKLTLSRITLYTIFPLHLVRIMNFWNRTQYVLFMIREAARYKLSICHMKCGPIRNIIKLRHYCWVPSSSFFLCG